MAAKVRRKLVNFLSSRGSINRHYEVGKQAKNLDFLREQSKAKEKIQLKLL